MLAEDADQELVSWLADPPHHAPKLLLYGSPGAGKTALLSSLHEELPGSLFLDCRHLTAEQVLSRLLRHFGLQVRRRPLSDPLTDTLSGLRKGGIVLLANVQWAGPFHSSTDSELIDRLIGRFTSQGGGHVLPVLEGLEPRARAEGETPDEILLDGRPYEVDPADLLAAHPALRSLATAELPEVPLHVWEFMDGVLGDRHTGFALGRIAEQLGDVLLLRADQDGTPTVRLASDGLARLLRQVEPITPAEQLAVTEALLAEAVKVRAGTAEPRIAAYAGRALAVHAALSGELPRLIEEQPALAAIADRVSLQQAIKLAWPGGPPVPGVAADAHYLHCDGVAPDAQGEWLAWLHWAAVNRDRRDWADRLEDACHVPLAWRTVWSKWRPYGVLGARPDLPGAVEDVSVGRYSDATVVASEHGGVFSQDELEEALGDAADEWGDDHRRERVWRLSDGEELLEPRVVHRFVDDEGRVTRTVGSALDTSRPDSRPSAEHPDWPGPLIARTAVEAAGDGRWVGYGPRGLYVFDVLNAGELTSGPGRPRVWQQPFLSLNSATALWPLPSPVAEGGEALTSWLARTFGEHALGRIPASEVPAELSESQARMVLCETGFPALDGTAPTFLTTVPIDRSGLEPFVDPGSPGGFSLLGHWLAQPVVLDTRSGRVVLMSAAGNELLGSSLLSFLTLVGLYRQFRLSEFPVRSAEERDARRSMKSWAREIDPEAAASSNWQAALAGQLDKI
ncbi:SUKH-4 family immunity protein [Streptomyces sp. NPDC102394]|uniref:SUKH-4 family immunity protein n=1 Tax=Streptomyces sp. NPDC102394 TaxID=3366167 RepID=UPI00382F6053